MGFAHVFRASVAVLVFFVPSISFAVDGDLTPVGTVGKKEIVCRLSNTEKINLGSYEAKHEDFHLFKSTSNQSENDSRERNSNSSTRSGERISAGFERSAKSSSLPIFNRFRHLLQTKLQLRPQLLERFSSSETVQKWTLLILQRTLSQKTFFRVLTKEPQMFERMSLVKS